MRERLQKQAHCSAPSLQPVPCSLNMATKLLKVCCSLLVYAIDKTFDVTRFQPTFGGRGGLSIAFLESSPAPLHPNYTCNWTPLAFGKFSRKKTFLVNNMISSGRRSIFNFTTFTLPSHTFQIATSSTTAAAAAFVEGEFPYGRCMAVCMFLQELHSTFHVYEIKLARFFLRHRKQLLN